MIVGMFDGDMSKYIHVPVNLELMKLSSYYKKKGDIVSLSPIFSPDMYNKFIYRKDYYDGTYPMELVHSNIIEYGGRAFNMDNYEPLPLEIEKQKPDIYIYENFRKDFCTNKEKERDFKTMMNAEHFRLSLDGINIWNDFEKQININQRSNTLFLHDYNLNNIKNSDIIIKEIMNNMSKNHRHLATKFPIKVNNEEDLFRWIEPFSLSKKYFNLEYNGIMKDEIFTEFIVKQKYKIKTKQFEYCINEGISENEFITSGINKIFKQLIFLRMNHQYINFKYNSMNFTDKRWCKVLDLFQAYLLSRVSFGKEKYIRTQKYDSLFNYVSNLKESSIYEYIFTKQKARELFQFIRKNNYELFKDFYECHAVTLKGGKLQNE